MSRVNAAVDQLALFAEPLPQGPACRRLGLPARFHLRERRGRVARGDRDAAAARGDLQGLHGASSRRPLRHRVRLRRQPAAPGPPLPEALEPLRDKAAAWVGEAAEALSSALVAEYRPGVPLGWHRDVPDFETVVGISLAGTARMRFRRYPPVQPKKADVLSLELAPRSAYVLRAEARWGWQHSVAPTPALRYSITFGPARRGPRAVARTAEARRPGATPRRPPADPQKYRVEVGRAASTAAVPSPPKRFRRSGRSARSAASRSAFARRAAARAAWRGS